MSALRTVVPSGLVAVFLLLAALHVYWALGGRWGASVAVPEVDGRPAFRPGRGATVSVALLLALAAAVIAIRSNLVQSPALSVLPAKLGAWTLFAVFLLRAVGDFKRVGLFKATRDTAFARYDTFLFSPLSLAIALGCLLSALGP